MMNFSETSEFKKELKHFAKKWRSIPDDIAVVRQYILPLYEQIDQSVDIKKYREGFFNGKNATILYSIDTTEVVKMRLDVADLGSGDKVRLIFIAIRNKDEILFTEIYVKNEKPREDQKRINKYLKVVE